MSTNGTMEQASGTLTRTTARRLQQASTTEVPQKLKEKVNLAVLDYLGAIASGLQSPWSSQVIKYARSRKGAQEAHAWGLQDDISAETAAFVNSLLAHSAIRDDMHLKSNSHIGSIIISAALALAQRDGWTGEQLLRSIIGGYEASALLGVAVQQSKGYNRHMRPSGVIGAFGAAGAAIAATNANEDVAVNALAFAANMASGFNEWAWAGGLEIYTEMGSASQAGIVAFDLARAGLQCSETVIEGRAGLFAAFSATEGEHLFEKGLEAEIGTGIMDVQFKPVPGCNYAQTPLAVALKIAQNHDLSKGIAGVSVSCTSGAKNYPGCDNPGPFTTVQQTKMSIQFGVCAALIHKDVSEEVFGKFDSEEITNLASQCTIEELKEYAQSFSEGRQPARVEVELKGGETIKEELSDVPWLDSKAVIDRFYSDTKGILGSEKSQKELVRSFEGLSDLQECSRIWGLFKGSEAQRA